MTETIELPRTGGAGAGLGGNLRVIVRNDDHNTFDHVALSLARTIPGVSVQQGYAYADAIHASGQAMVWSGLKEPAELYWEQLNAAGLTRAPPERGGPPRRCRRPRGRPGPRPGAASERRRRAP